LIKDNRVRLSSRGVEAVRHEGLSPEESIYQACLIRFRPIMMTTMAALFGAVLLAIGMGVGSVLRQPLGIAIVGGLIVSQMLTLCTAPVIYLALEQMRQRRAAAPPPRGKSAGAGLAGCLNLPRVGSPRDELSRVGKPQLPQDGYQAAR
jgi:predicted RND superfamily exporter protein